MIRQVAISLIDPNPYQPRLEEDQEHIANLAASIAADGMMQIPSAREHPHPHPDLPPNSENTNLGEGVRYELAFGHSRLAAYKLLNRLQGEQVCEAEAESAMARAWKEAREANLGDFTEMPLNIIELDDEAMFRAAIAENEKRKDLSAVERARAMARYRDEFGKSSAEIGELFGCADATVRGTIRLLELPAGARELLNRGELSQGAARALLSMQRLATEEIVKTAQRIIKDGAHSTPEVVVDTAMNHYALRMWGRGWNNDEKPRAGYHGWLIEMKNFPNKYLPALTLSDLPHALNHQAENTGLLRIIAHSEDVVDASMKLGQSCDPELRELAAKIDILLDPPGCSTCPFCAKLDGSYYCGLQACFERKGLAWKREKLLTASKTLGITLYDELDGPYQALEMVVHKQLFNARGPDLRLIDREKVKGYPSQYGFEGVNTDTFYVVAIGKTLQKMKDDRKAERAAEKSGLHLIRGRSDLVSDKKDHLAWEAAHYVGELLFKDFTPAALNALNRSVYNWANDAPSWATPKHKTIEDPYPDDFLKRKFGLNMLKKKMGYDLYQMGVEKYAEELNGAISALGMTPWVGIVEMARVMQAEIDERFPEDVEGVSAETA
jgi:ParB-like chromosome segregation protein Spo0J